MSLISLVTGGIVTIDALSCIWMSAYGIHRLRLNDKEAFTISIFIASLMAANIFLIVR